MKVALKYSPFYIVFLSFHLAISPGNSASLPAVTSHDGDPAFRTHLLQLMGNYSSWLHNEDPFPSASLPLVLQLRGDNILNHVDVEIEFHNLYMQGHSRPNNNSIISANSQLNTNTFSIGIENIGKVVTFGGYYIIKKGAYRANSTSLPIPLRGKGTWILKTNHTNEQIKYQGFSLNPDGRINLSGANISWAYTPKWTNIQFDGLTFNDTDTSTEDYAVASKALSELYYRFLNAVGTDESQTEVILPRYLITKYLDLSLKKTPLSDIIGE